MLYWSKAWQTPSLGRRLERIAADARASWQTLARVLANGQSRLAAYFQHVEQYREPALTYTRDLFKLLQSALEIAAKLAEVFLRRTFRELRRLSTMDAAAAGKDGTSERLQKKLYDHDV